MLTEENISQDELERIAQVRSGNQEAFTWLVEQYQIAVYNLCYRMLGNPGEAEDAAQETFWRVYRAIDRYDPKRKFSTWILSIATNYCIDQLRKRRLMTVSLDAMPFLDVRDAEPGPELSLLNGEREQRVKKLLSLLGEKDRAAVIMRYWYDFSYDEIAQALSLTNSAVKSRLHRARRALAQAWPAMEAMAMPQPLTKYAYDTQAI